MIADLYFPGKKKRGKRKEGEKREEIGHDFDCPLLRGLFNND